MPGYGSTSGGQQRSDKTLALGTGDAVYAAAGNYVRGYCVSGIQGNWLIFGKRSAHTVLTFILMSDQRSKAEVRLRG